MNNGHITWITDKRSIKDLSPAPYNPRQWPEKETKDLKESLERFNLADPIVINTNNRIIGGHFRLKILKDKGLDEVDVRVPSRELTEQEERELNLRLNKNLGQWDFDALVNFDEELLLGVGFSPAELDNIFDLNAGQIDKDETPEPPTNPKAKLGEIYQLGQHRVMCGDSTDLRQIEALLTENGQVLKADMLFTDPPYNVNYAGTGENTSNGIENDNLSKEDFDRFIGKIFENAYEAMKEGGGVLHLFWMVVLSNV